MQLGGASVAAAYVCLRAVLTLPAAGTLDMHARAMPWWCCGVQHRVAAPLLSLVAKLHNLPSVCAHLGLH